MAGSHRELYVPGGVAREFSRRETKTNAQKLGFIAGQERVQKPQRAQSAHPSRRPYNNFQDAYAASKRMLSPPPSPAFSTNSYEQPKVNSMRVQLKMISQEIASAKKERAEIYQMMQSMRGKLRPQSARWSNRGGNMTPLFTPDMSESSYVPQIELECPYRSGRQLHDRKNWSHFDT
eukprot:CAMPEP_0196601250 /NCGR_PEP_ID=MMETSP1081-20130531/95813_1 /TAXON_ID=36882 /ORGANISM="Pyramimonas amylifera, Strain CCMP720" /LENGTH=176 /DNA_ID=CAMNT_0041927121 /DNA_START=1845 /DNA_END=2375 /DNA_ORIENTATION=+